MTEYQRPSFTVKTGGRRPEECGHGWVNPEKGRCVTCGARVYRCMNDCGRHVLWSELRHVRTHNPEWGNGIMTIGEHMERDLAAGRYTPSIIEPWCDISVCPACLAALLPPDGA